ncbi:MAG TPA: protein kinase, partial [Myxococcales bacterium]|nr:protein kinase [Myxococcales bacterium]
GGMGTVYKAVQAPLDRLVALKVLNANYDSKRDPGFQRRFFLEASVTSKLKHPNTITVIDYGKTEDNIYYIAMEFVEGITLAQVVATEGSIEWSRCLNIAQQVCRSLREAHKAGIIHRDLKPANVMICNEETDHDLVKVLDFGLVKSFQSDSPHAKDAAAADLTQAGVFLGSPQYMAPEQARNLADPRSDIYSLGVVIYQIMMGRPPFMAEQSIDVIVKHMKEAPPPFSQVRPDLEIPPEVEAVVMRCLEKDPAKRYQTMDELLEGMRRASSSAGISGLFSGPRFNHSLPPATPPPMIQPGQSGPMKVPPGQTGPRKLPTGPHVIGPSGPHVKAPTGPHVRPPTGPHARPHSGAFNQGAVEVVEVETDPVGVPAAGQKKRGRAVPAAIFLGSVVLGLGVVWALTRAETPLPKGKPGANGSAGAGETPGPAIPQNPTQTATTSPAAAAVKFKIDSDPQGAKVTSGGKELGETPLEFTRAPGEDGTASAELVFAKSGYESLTITAAGSGDVVVSQKLRKKPAPPPQKTKKNNSASGYKDDPYQ